MHYTSDSFLERLKTLDNIYAGAFYENKVNHKDFYLRFAMEVLVRKVSISIFELIKTLEEQYIRGDFIQSPIIENKKYNIVVAPTLLE